MIESEVTTRISSNLLMQRLFLENRQAFDEIVIYSGESAVYDLKGLEVQYDSIISKRRKIQKMLNDKKYVEIPYSGNEPFVFVSYAHDDIETVYQILSMLQRNSCRVWYDDGIAGSTNWRKIIASKIKTAQAVILFSSKAASVSEHVEAEINCAFMCKKPIYTVRLDDSVFELAYEMYLSVNQMLSVNMDDFENRLIGTLPKNIRA